MVQMWQEEDGLCLLRCKSCNSNDYQFVLMFSCDLSYQFPYHINTVIVYQFSLRQAGEGNNPDRKQHTGMYTNKHKHANTNANYIRMWLTAPPWNCLKDLTV